MAYRADIEIAVRGAQQLKQLTRDISNVSNLVDGLNGYLETFGNGISRSFNNISDAVQDARNNLNRAVIGTQEATAAAYQLIRAETQLNEVLADREQLLRKVRLAGKPTAGPAGGFPTEGPMTSPGFRGMQKNIGRFGENLALGAGFPLLFGGGAGSVIGSVLGSFVGTGFGGQILGGALGQALDQALVKIKDIGNAIKTLDFKTLTESGIRLSAEIQGQLELLTQVGDKLTAQKILSQEIANETGTLPGVTEDVANSVNILSDSWRKVVNAVSSTVGIIGAPFAVALAAILEAVNAIFRLINGVFSLLGKGLKTIGEFVVQLVAGQGALDAINNGLDRMNSGLAEANAQASQFRATLNQSVVQSAIELQTTRQLTPGVTSADKVKNIQLQTQKELDLLFQEEIDARVKIRQENAKASTEIVQGLIKQNELLYKNRAETIKINSDRQVAAEVQRNQVEQERKINQELEKQRRELERIAKLRVEQLNTAQQNYVLAEAELDVVSYEDPIRKAQAEYDKNRTQRMFKYAELLRKALSDEERAFIVSTQYAEVLKEQVTNENTILEIQKKQTAELYAQLGASGILNADVQKRLEKAAGGNIPGLERIGIAGFDRGMNLDPNDKAAQKYDEMKRKLEELADPINMAEKGAQAIGSAFSTAFQGIITGTQSTQEALSNFFKGVGEAFINMATEIIAQMVTMFAFKTLLGIFGGGSTGLFSGAGPYALPSGGGFAGGFNMPSLMAEGGFVTGPTRAVIGEGGEPEYVIPASKMRTAMGRYAAGARGSSVIPSGGDGGTMGGTATMGATTIDVRYSVERINNVDYVTADQFQAGMQEAAAKGAAEGQRQTLRRLQQSPSTRRRIGV